MVETHTIFHNYLCRERQRRGMEISMTNKKQSDDAHNEDFELKCRQFIFECEYNFAWTEENLLVVGNNSETRQIPDANFTEQNCNNGDIALTDSKPTETE